MKARYVLINVEERDNFEKEWQLPFGYDGCFITFEFKDAVRQLELYKYDYYGCSIERIDENGREIVYKYE